MKNRGAEAMIQTTEFNEEVLYATQSIVRVTRNDINMLKKRTEGILRHRIRLCAHSSVSDTLHEMLIVHTKGAYVRPHKHLNKIESFHVIEGHLDVIIFDDDGNITDIISMSDYSSGKTFYYRMNQSAYHTLLIHSDLVVFHETTNGPFKRADAVFASWAPEEDNQVAIEQFLNKLQLSKD